MNLYFNSAIHILTFLAKHPDEVFSSQKLAELLCINPVQLRNIMRVLVNKGYVRVQKGSKGGYQSIEQGQEIKLSEIFEQFRHAKNDSRIYTGNKDSHCEIARNIGEVMQNFANQEYFVLKEFYSNYRIKDVLNQILKGEM